MRPRITRPFNIETEKVFCAACGQRCVEAGHLFSQFLLCPTHGEFTISPVVVFVHDRDDWFEQKPVDYTGRWEIHFRDETEMASWETCKIIPPNSIGTAATG